MWAGLKEEDDLSHVEREINEDLSRQAGAVCDLATGTKRAVTKRAICE